VQLKSVQNLNYTIKIYTSLLHHALYAVVIYTSIYDSAELRCGDTNESENYVENIDYTKLVKRAILQASIYKAKDCYIKNPSISYKHLINSIIKNIRLIEDYINTTHTC